jgi:predicted nucleic acid-binding protein
MSLKRTFLDSGVLISAARGTDNTALNALQILDDSDRAFVSSIFVKLEVLPKAIYSGFHEEAVFYQSYFENDVDLWVSFSDELAETAQQQARKFGLSALDALHVATAISARVDEFITTEKRESPCTESKAFE